LPDRGRTRLAPNGTMGWLGWTLGGWCRTRSWWGCVMRRPGSGHAARWRWTPRGS
jgi:hypothetical protein